MTVCPMCKSPIIQAERGRRRKWCSTSCKSKAQRIRERARAIAREMLAR